MVDPQGNGMKRSMIDEDYPFTDPLPEFYFGDNLQDLFEQELIGKTQPETQTETETEITQKLPLKKTLAEKTPPRKTSEINTIVVPQCWASHKHLVKTQTDLHIPTQAELMYKTQINLLGLVPETSSDTYRRCGVCRRNNHYTEQCTYRSGYKRRAGTADDEPPEKKPRYS